MSRKPGKKSRSRYASFRVNEQEKAELNELAKRLGMSASACVRGLVHNLLMILREQDQDEPKHSDS